MERALFDKLVPSRKKLVLFIGLVVNCLYAQHPAEHTSETVANCHQLKLVAGRCKDVMSR